VPAQICCEDIYLQILKNGTLNIPFRLNVSYTVRSIYKATNNADSHSPRQEFLPNSADIECLLPPQQNFYTIGHLGHTKQSTMNHAI
jgi:hypothetical protein